MALDITGLIDAAISHAAATGRFEKVNGHEPKSPPTTGGLTAAVWAQDVSPVRVGSGLASTTVRLELAVRLYASLQQDAADAIDPDLIAALDELMRAYSADFTFGGQVRNVDLLGAHGTSLRAQAGYLRHGDSEYRVMTITLPLIVNDLWDQEA